MAQRSEHPEAEETAAQQLVRLLEEHGLENSLRAILDAMQARKAKDQRQARLELLEWMLEGQPPLTEEELEQARREWQE